MHLPDAQTDDRDAVLASFVSALLPHDEVLLRALLDSASDGAAQPAGGTPTGTPTGTPSADGPAPRGD